MVLVELAFGLAVLVLVIIGGIKLAEKLKIHEAVRKWFKQE